MTTTLHTITILRHAEKPSAADSPQPAFGVNEQGRPQAESLTPRGWQRAGALAAVLGSATPPAPFVRPAALFAPAYPDGASHRPGETITPLARRLKLHIQTPVPKGQEDILVSDSLLSQSGQDVLVCWEHHHIPAIAAALALALGVNTLTPNGTLWPDTDFSSALVFARQPNGLYTLMQTRLRLLDGD
ncbi:hypothetical protein [Deinococcus sp. AJ005]|uniref:hypothetical protein n=1 Tax=Deinococcus sp. AJ005 TaxID=2652443 RepID=UPI00125CC34B|nr:hypothetical protein [Deinococcus sp. AJ005]QFP75520.1 hypothetical protein DAAJ005_02880 [Deinococcus sp. AJ005]